MTARQKGNVLVECLVLTPVWVALFSIAFGGLGQLAIREAFRAKAYLLARAHLYGNDRGVCSISFPKIPVFAESVACRCSGAGTVSVDVRGRGPFRYTLDIDLVNGGVS